MSTNILFIGATGYLGGPTLLNLLAHPKRSSFEITVLIRDASKAKDFEAYGLRVVIGSLADFNIVEHESAEADFVFQSANCDDVPGTEAILRGLKTRFEKTNTAPVLIHTSGTGVLIDNALGKFKTQTVYSDLDIPHIETLPVTQMHRPVDVVITAAGTEGYVKTYIVIPPTIWGVASNEFTQKGLQNPVSRQIPDLIDLSVTLRKVAIVGEGLNVWPHVELQECVDFYRILFDAILDGKNPAHGREGYYFLENGEYSQHQLVDITAKVLFDLGKVDTAYSALLTEEEKARFPMAYLAGTNARCRAERARALGWKPTQGTDAFLASIEPEVQAWLKRHA